MVLLWLETGPVLPILLLAAAQALLPTILLASIATSLDSRASAGVAFGVVEVLDCGASLVGNVLFGQLFNLTGDYRAGLLGLFAWSLLGLALLAHSARTEHNVTNDDTIQELEETGPRTAITRRWDGKKYASV